MALGIDISTYQGTPDFDQVRKEKEFVIVRSSYGVGFKDVQFNRNRDELRNKGIAHGFYHYAYPQYNIPEREAQWFLDVVGTLEKGEVLVLDHEEDWSNFEDWKNWAAIFLDYIKNRIGLKPLIYINLSKANAGSWKRVIDGDYGLWLALWDGNPSTAPKTQWPVIAMKQYSATGRVSGINGDVDLNVFFGDVNTFKLYGYNPPTPKPDEIEYHVIETSYRAIFTSQTYEGGKARYDEGKVNLKAGNTITLIKYNKTQDRKEILETYTKPAEDVTVYGVDLSKTEGVEFEFELESDALNAFTIQQSEMGGGETIDLLKIITKPSGEKVVEVLQTYTKPIVVEKPPRFNLIIFIIDLIKKIWER